MTDTGTRQCITATIEAVFMFMNIHIEHRRPGTLCMAMLLAVTMLTASGCATLGSDRDASAEPPFTAAGASARDQLNDGYSDLYATADALSQVDRIFYVKFESDAVQRVVQDITQYNGQLAKRLSALTSDFPALDIGRQTAPPIIRAAREAQKKATLKRFAPVVGASGAAFERGILIRLLGAVDQQHYIAATLAAREPVPALSKIMGHAADRYAGLYDEIDTLLKARFYR